VGKNEHDIEKGKIVGRKKMKTFCLLGHIKWK
jgi:hypothetical protein